MTRDFISSFDSGKIFTYDNISSDKKSTIAIELSRLYKQGVINKISRSKYYKPKMTPFGEIGPSSKDKIDSFINTSKLSYVTGLDSLRQLGLTTQISNTIIIASDKPAQRVKVNNINIKFVKSRVSVPRKYSFLLQILDALKDIKSIPDTSPNEALQRLKSIISNLEIDKQKKLAIFASKYTPRTKALLGAILKDLGLWEEAYNIKKQLNQLTKYKLGIKAGILKNKEEWGIT